MKRKICVMLFLCLMLCACGKEEQILQKKPEEVTVERKEELEQEENVEPVEKVQDTESVTEKEDVLAETKTKTSSLSNNANKKNTQNQSEGKKNIDTTAEQQKPSTQPFAENGAPTQNQEVQKSTTEKKMVDSYTEEVTGPEYPFKYGVTQYEWRFNQVAVFDDGSKEILNSNIETRFNQSNYHATDDELRAETEENISRHMAYYQEVLRLVNEERAKVGVGPLTLDLTMCKAATMRSIEMDYSGKLSHTRPNGNDCFTALNYYGVQSSFAGENISGAPSTPAYAVLLWKNSSSGHYETMINPEYTKTGVGYSNAGVGKYGNYWCQLFAK